MRLFAAIELDTGVTDRLLRLQRELSLPANAVRWISAAQMHLTLKFLGEVADGEVDDVCAALKLAAEATPAFEMDVAGVGCFPPAGPVRIVWAGLSEPTGALSACQRRCDDALAETGFKPEARAFTPHLTIGRVRDSSASAAIRAAVSRVRAFEGGRQGVDEIVLFESLLKREGAEYVAVCRCPLATERG